MKTNFYIKFWKADSDTEEWREFNTDEIPELVELGILGEDNIAGYMEDQRAFDDTMVHMAQLGRSWDYKEMVSYYINHTDRAYKIG